MIVIDKALCKIGFSIIIFVVPEMLFKSRLKRTAALSSVFLFIFFTNELINPTFFGICPGWCNGVCCVVE
jgi:hypothetical protein